MIPCHGMGATDSPTPQPVTTRTEDSDAEVDRAIVWAVRRRKPILGIVALVIGGAGLGWTGLKGIQAEAEERVLRRQAAERQSQAVLSNGRGLGELHERMGQVESDIASHAEMTRTALEILMASQVIDDGLRARAAGFVTSGE